MLKTKTTFEVMHLKFEKTAGEDFKKIIRQAQSILDAIGLIAPNK